MDTYIPFLLSLPPNTRQRSLDHSCFCLFLKTVKQLSSLRVPWKVCEVKWKRYFSQDDLRLSTVVYLQLLSCDPTNCSPLGSSVHGILQARILEWVAISFSWGDSPTKDGTHISCVSYTGGSVQSLSRVWLFVPHGLQHARPLCPSPTPGVLLKLTPFQSVTGGFSTLSHLGSPLGYLILCNLVVLCECLFFLFQLKLQD